MTDRKRNHSRLEGAGHEAAQRVVTRLLDEEAIPEKIVCRSPCRGLAMVQLTRQRRDIRAPTHRTLNQALGFKLGVGVPHGRAMDAQTPRQFAARLQAITHLERAGHDPLPDLIADLDVQRFVQARIKR